jgi:hypothetical protein
MMRRAAIAFFAAAVASCGRAASGGLVAVPDRLTLLGPGHGRTLAVYAGTASIAESDLVAVIGDAKIVDVHGLRVRALATGSTTLEIASKDGATAAIEIDVGQEVSPFIRSIVEQHRGAGDGFGRDRLPDVILGPPKGGGEYQGSTDVLSLGIGGSITVSFAPLRIYDGPGPDFMVFENAFEVLGSNVTSAEPGIVAVALDDGPFAPFDCDLRAYPFAGCAGVRPVLAGPGAPDIDPTDPARAGGDAFDLLHHLPVANRVRVTDAGTGQITPSGTSGFDLDAMAIVHALPDDAIALHPSPESLALRVGESSPAPRADVLRAGGATIYGLDAKRALSASDSAVLEGDLVRAVRPGEASLILSTGVLTATVSIRVTP